MILQILCSVFSIIFVIAIAVLMGMGMNQMENITEKAYRMLNDSSKCEFDIRYRMGYFIPFITNIIFIILSILKKVFEEQENNTCPNCGVENQAGNKFCFRCGHKL